MTTWPAARPKGLSAGHPLVAIDDWTVRFSLHLAEVRECVVGLDLRAGRYVLFRGEAAAILRRLLRSEPTFAELNWLHQHDVIEPASVSRSSVELPPTPIVSLFDERRQAMFTRTGLAAALAQLRSARRLRAHALNVVLDNLAQRLDGAVVAEPAAYQHVLDAYRWSRRLVSQADQCLVCSIAMAGQLAAHGLRARLVIGVTLPFAAHCWLQVGTTALTDSVDTIRGFTPIYTL